MNTPTTIAAEFGTDARTMRKFLRSEGAGVGKGSRYSLPTSKREVASLRKRFNAWDAARAPQVDDAPEVPTDA